MFAVWGGVASRNHSCKLKNTNPMCIFKKTENNPFLMYTFTKLWLALPDLAWKTLNVCEELQFIYLSFPFQGKKERFKDK